MAPMTRGRIAAAAIWLSGCMGSPVYMIHRMLRLENRTGAPIRLEVSEQWPENRILAVIALGAGEREVVPLVYYHWTAETYEYRLDWVGGGERHPLRLFSIGPEERDGEVAVTIGAETEEPGDAR